jgi:mRNA interferase RelE/StbE
MKVAFAAAAWRDWKKFPEPLRARLQKKLLQYAEDPFRYAIKLSDDAIGQYRFRVGDYRIIFDIIENQIVVLAVGNRKDIYQG